MFVYCNRFVSKPSSWYLLLTWLTDALQTHNTPLLVEMLELLLLCPMTEERLKDSEITALIQAKLNRNDLEQLIQFVAQQYNDQSEFSFFTFLFLLFFNSLSFFMIFFSSFNRLQKFSYAVVVTLVCKAVRS